MAGKKTLAMTDRQFAVLELLWEHGPMTVRELIDHFPDSEALPYTTVLGLLQNMEKSGLVSHDKEVVTHRYRPNMTRKEATGNLLSDFARRFFRGSASRLVLGLVQSDQLTQADLKELEDQLAKARNNSNASDSTSAPVRKPQSKRGPS